MKVLVNEVGAPTNKFPALYKFVGSYGNSRKPQSLNDHLIILFANKNNGICMNTGLTCRNIGEDGFSINIDSDWRILEVHESVTLSNS